MNYYRYSCNPFPDMSTRRWPSNTLKAAPVWCSVDLRDGNQALTEPMNVEEKIRFFKLLLKLGFKEIEVGFPSSSQIEFDFVRKLIEQKLIPADVRIQVLAQCRPHLLERTFEAIEGAENVIFHIYNNTSKLQREIVYGISCDEVKAMAVNSALKVKDFAQSFPGHITLEYSPESFIETEPEFALEICNAVIEAWQPDDRNGMIINFPTTVEKNTPNVFADRIEWISDRLISREKLILSVHPHNDRGTGVAAGELAMLAGAQRVEGTLFGNGERTGNVDLVTMACNLMSEGIDPELDFSDIISVRHEYESLVRQNVPERQPYAGDLVFTAFSGGHQDAINKAIRHMEQEGSDLWQVPYLPVDPADVGRKYEPLVRINSQSGKGGVAFIMESYHGFRLPKGMCREFSDIIQELTETEGELNPDRIMAEFKKHYIDRKEPYHFRHANMEDVAAAAQDIFHTVATIIFTDHGVERSFEAKGNGPIDATKIGIQNALGRSLRILDYSEHALKEGSNAQAAAYIHLMDSVSGRTTYGVGVSSSTTRASIRALFSALNRMED